MTRYFISQSGEWYRLSPNGKVHALHADGKVMWLRNGDNLNWENLLMAKAIKETDKKNWVQACKWFRKFPGSFIQ